VGGGGATGTGTGGSTVVSCAGLVFTAPTNGVTLTAADDASGDACGNGFQYDVTVGSLTAPDGTKVALIGTSVATTTTLSTALVSAGQVVFPRVLLPTGNTVLAIKFDSMAAACATTSSFTVDCTKPALTIIAPAADTATFGDVTKHLLAASATQAFKDSSSASVGAQTTVVACTNRVGSANLFVGPAGGTLIQTGTPVPSVVAGATDGCPSGLPFVAKFVGVTLPESTENPDGTLSKATEIRVDLTDAATATAVGSGLRDVWVDSIPPTISAGTPSPLCGGTQAGPGAFTTNVTFNSSTSNLKLAITNGGATTTLVSPGYDGAVATFSNVALAPGANDLAVTATDAAGNTAQLAPPASCTFTVGMIPVVSFVSPPLNGKLCAAGNTSPNCVADTAAGTAGWQGPIMVAVTVNGAPVTTRDNVTFTIGGTPQTVALDGTGQATVTASIPDAAAATVTVTTASIGTSGIGTTTSTFLVDTAAPSAPTSLLATVIDRRQTAFLLSWKAPADGSASVGGYDIRVKSYSPATSTCGADIRTVPFVGTPKAAGGNESITVSNLLIETDYCFSVAGTDAVGNAGTAAIANGKATFNLTTLTTANPTQVFGSILDGTGDFGGPTSGFANDGYSDLAVGVFNGQSAYLFFGGSGGYSTTPDVTITGPASRRFGGYVANAGDLDGDGLSDLAIAAPGIAATDPAVIYIFSRKNASWGVNGAWPATLDYTQANYTITADASYDGAQFGLTMAKMGNFDGAGAGDLAISAYLYSMGTGAQAGRVVIVKGSSSFGSITLPDPTNTIVIDGEAPGDRLGRSMEVLVDDTFVVSSYLAANGSLTAAGKLYAFKWPLASTLTASLMTASDVSVLGNMNGNYGFVLSALSGLGGTAAVVTASAPGSGGNFVDIDISSAADGTFVGPAGSTAIPSIRLTSSTTLGSFGAVDIGGLTLGQSSFGSFIGGDAVPDLVVAGQRDPAGTIYIVSGASLVSFPPAVDLATSTAPGIVAIKNRLPAGWTTFGRGSYIVDLNGDGYSDVALGESGTSLPGRALVFW
jgi:hypothetical protein